MPAPVIKPGKGDKQSETGKPKPKKDKDKGGDQ